MPRDPKDRLPADRLPADRLIVALDVDSLDRATALVDALSGQVTRFKIGSQLFTATGPSAAVWLRRRIRPDMRRSAKAGGCRFAAAADRSARQ